MAFDFELMSRLLVALTRGDAVPVADALMRAALPDGCQWATFLRNHDEFGLSSLPARDQEWLLDVGAPDPRMRLHGGIRRRLAPLLRQRSRIELAFALLLALPGSPIVYYGDEIGMGDDIRLPDRDGIRTPMQWSDDVHGGFSDSRAARLVTPVIEDPAYGYRTLNVAAQLCEPGSLLSRVRCLLAVRRRHRAFGRGSIQLLPTHNPAVFAFVRRFEDEAIVVAANLSGSAVSVELDLPDGFVGSRLRELVDDVPFPPAGPQPYRLSLSPYGSYWLQCVAAGSPAVGITQA